jgi:hypothetical protein
MALADSVRVFRNRRHTKAFARTGSTTLTPPTTFPSTQ